MVFSLYISIFARSSLEHFFSVDLDKQLTPRICGILYSSYSLIMMKRGDLMYLKMYCAIKHFHC